MFVLATPVQFGSGWVFYKEAFAGLRHKKLGMATRRAGWCSEVGGDPRQTSATNALRVWNTRFRKIPEGNPWVRSELAWEFDLLHDGYYNICGWSHRNMVIISSLMSFHSGQLRCFDVFPTDVAQGLSGTRDDPRVLFPKQKWDDVDACFQCLMQPIYFETPSSLSFCLQPGPQDCSKISDYLCLY